MFWTHIKRAGCFGRSCCIVEPKVPWITIQEEAPGAKLQHGGKCVALLAKHFPVVRPPPRIRHPTASSSSLLVLLPAHSPCNMTDVRKHVANDTCMQITDVSRIVLSECRRASTAQGHKWKFQVDMQEAHRTNLAARGLKMNLLPETFQHFRCE